MNASSPVQSSLEYDQCKTCISRGNKGKCDNTHCTVHQSWYVTVLRRNDRSFKDSTRKYLAANILPDPHATIDDIVAFYNGRMLALQSAKHIVADIEENHQSVQALEQLILGVRLLLTTIPTVKFDSGMWASYEGAAADTLDTIDNIS